MKTVIAAWVLSLLNATEPNAPWKDTYPATADEFARVANAEPLFAGDDGAAKTAALFVSVSWFESRHKPDAEGDHTCLARDAAGKCTKKGEPRSFCLGQIGASNFAALGVTRASIQSSVSVCVGAMHEMLKRSLRVCAAHPLNDRLSWYATGGADCRPVRESTHRVRKAMWLLGAYPPPDSRFADAR